MAAIFGPIQDRICGPGEDKIWHCGAEYCSHIQLTTIGYAHDDHNECLPLYIASCVYAVKSHKQWKQIQMQFLHNMGNWTECLFGAAR